MGDMPIGKLLFRLSPPVMLALLIQSVYNIVDSYFVAQYSLTGLTALSLVFPIQQLATALATGAGTGLGILIARMDGSGDTAAQRDAIKSGLWLGVFDFALFACVTLAALQGYFALSSDQPLVRQQGVQYARVVLAGSLGLVVLLVPLAWVFHFAGLTYVWLTFPVTEVLSVLCALVFYRRTPFLSKRRNAE